MNTALGILGAFVVVVVLVDVVQTIVLPRRSPRWARPTSYLIAGLWLLWRAIGLRMQSRDGREGFLGSFGPLAVLLLLVGWAFCLVVGYGLLLDALPSQIHPAPRNLGEALYFAATALLTIGFGDIVATGGLARAVTLCAGGSGLGIFALVISFLYSLYGSFQQRETSVVVLEAAASAPPSGVTLLETYSHLGLLDELPRLFADWQVWAAQVLDSHLAFPILAYFRSSHENDSWVSSLGAVMDASTLVLTVVEGGPKGRAKLFQAVGGHCLEDLVQYMEVPAEDGVGIERSEFDEARQRLSRAGWELRDAEEAWADFSRLRSTYAGRVNALARYWATPPAQWIGDRSGLKHRHVRDPISTRL
ncbi:MAG TPA: ion channel [Chloroflexota bacterium]|nr:ion channel [Chloroflexota bacterium]